MTFPNSNVFLTRVLKSVFSSTLLVCVVAFSLLLPSLTTFTFDPHSVLNVPLALVAAVSFIVVTSRQYARTVVVSVNRFGKITKGLSIQSCWLAALCSASAWALSTLNPLRSGYEADARRLLDIGCTMAGALYHYENVYAERDFHFPIIQTSKYSMFMSKRSEIAFESMKKSFMYLFFAYFSLYAAEPLLRGDVYFIGTVWFSMSLVLYLFHSFEHILYLNMTERAVFPIVTINQDGCCLLSALNTENKIIKSLALYDLYQATIKDAKRRKEIFSLSFAGNVPQSWKIIFNYCINNIKSTTEDMTDSVKHVSPILTYRRNVPNARLLKLNGVSSGRQDEKNVIEPKETLSFLKHIRIYRYLFGQLDKEKSLEEFETTVWCCYILSNLAVVSLKEDDYGVVREQLGDIVSAILDLRNQLELQRRQVDLHKIKKLEYLQTHVKTCAVLLALNFGMYADDIGLDETQLNSFKKIITSLST